MKRREFMKLALRGLVLGCASHNSALALEADTSDIGSLFSSENEEILALTERVLKKCVLEKIRSPVEPLDHNWVYAGGYYRGQWLWDTMFVVDLLSILPGKRQLIRDIFQNYWDFQDRWNDRAPDYAHGMITVAIKTFPQAVRQFSQIPILAWGVERVYKRNHDKELLTQSLSRLEQFHEWFWRERDVTDIGLIAPGSYSGKTQHARWETFDYECCMDNLKLTPHPTRKRPQKGAWYGDICIVGNTAYLIMAEKSLVRLAEIMDDKDMAQRRTRRIEKAVRAMRNHMWDEDAGTFLAVHRDTREKIPVATISSWMPLMAGVPTQSMAARMAQTLRTPAWQTPLPVPTVDRTDKRFRSSGFWRGDVWPPTNYQIASGLARYGHKSLAADIADKTVGNALKNGVYEHYDSLSGKGLGVKDYCMSSTLVTMMLDGLTEKYNLNLRGDVRSRGVD